MLKFENTANVGDKIRAYDCKPLEGRVDRFIEGRVVEKGVHGYKVYGYKVYVTDAESNDIEYDMQRIGNLAIVPFEIGFDFDERITLIKETLEV